MARMVGLLAMTPIAAIRSLFSWRTKPLQNTGAACQCTLSIYKVNGLTVARNQTAFQTLNAHIISLGKPNGPFKNFNLSLVAARRNEETMSSPTAFLSGAPVRERGDMQPMCIVYADLEKTYYVKALTIASARSIILNVMGEIPSTHTFSVLNELPLECKYINEI